MFYDWYLNVKLNREKKKVLKELELEEFIRNKNIEHERRICEHSYELVGSEEKSRWDSDRWEKVRWTNFYLYCPKCDKTYITTSKTEVEIIINKQIARDDYNSQQK